MLKKNEEKKKIYEMAKQLINVDNKIFIESLLMTLGDKELSEQFEHSNFKDGLLNSLFFNLGEPTNPNNLEKCKIIIKNYELIQTTINFSDRKMYDLTHEIFKGACCKGSLDVVSCLLTTKLPVKININVENGYPLSLSALYGYLDIVDYLLTSPKLKKHADININDDNAIYYAADDDLHKNNEIIKYLLTNPKLEKHSNPNNVKKLPFHYACLHNNVELMELLWNTKGFDRDVSLYSLNSENQTTFELACDNTHGSEEAIIFLTTVCDIKVNKEISEYIEKNLNNENVQYYLNYMKTINEYKELEQEVDKKNDINLTNKKFKL